MGLSFRGPALFLAGLLLSASGLSAQEQIAGYTVISEALDSAGLTARLRELPELPTRKRALVKISFAASGEADSVEVRTLDRVSPEMRPLLLEAVWANVRTLAPDTTRRSTLIALATGKRVSLSAPEARVPVLRNAAAITRIINAFARKNGEMFVDGSKTAMVQFVLSPEGRAEQIRLLRSTGTVAIDQEALRVAGLFRFLPALIEGEPVPVNVTLPIMFARHPPHHVQSVDPLIR